MPLDVNIVSAFLVGLMGGVHCIGMCGGIVSALSLGISRDIHHRERSLLPFLLAYNGGRILSYSMAGAIVGALGGMLSGLLPIHYARLLLQLVAGGFMLALGLYLSGWWVGLLRLERAGSRLWRYLQPLGQRCLPVTTVAYAFRLGLVWGWLPCGLVYSVLVWSLSSGGALQGAMLMLSFGLGTLPLLLAVGIWSARLTVWLRGRWLRYLAGLLVMGYGVVMLVRSVVGLHAL